MTADLTARLAALLDEHAGYEWWPMTREFICTCEASIGTAYPDAAHRAHVVAVLAEAGVGFVAEAERERDEAWHFADRDLALDLKTVRAQRDRISARADRAEAALADLRTRVEALADET